MGLRRRQVLWVHGLVSQLLSVPLLTSAWGLETYGTWLILYAVPGFLALGDLGLATASSGMMIKAVARQDYQSALRIYETSRALGMIFAAIFCVITLLALLLFARFSSLQANFFEQYGLAIVALAIYALLGIWNSLSSTVFAAANRYATGSMIYFTIVLAEWFAAMCAALLGGGITAVALTYLCVRCGGAIVVALGLNRYADWARGARLVWHADTARELLRPAMAAFIMPMASAFAYSGTSVAIGASLGPGAVPVYVTLRTVTRTVLQFSMRVSFASMPGFALAYARQDMQTSSKYALISIGAVAGITIPAAAALMFIADGFVRWWTVGAIVVPDGLAVLLIAVMVCNAFWAPIANLLTAINRQETICYAYLVISMGGCLLAFLMGEWFGLRGVALTAVVAECLMLIAVWRAGMREKVLPLTNALNIIRSFAHRVRSL